MDFITFLLAGGALVFSILNRSKINKLIKQEQLNKNNQVFSNKNLNTNTQTSKTGVRDLRYASQAHNSGTVSSANVMTQTKKTNIFVRFFRWVKINPLMKIGSFFIILALAWFVQFAIAEGWIGEVGRITLALLVSSGVALFGFKDAFTDKDRGLTLFGVGITGIMASIYAAQELYSMFIPPVALSILFLTIAFSTFVALRFASKLLSGFVLLLATIVPFLVNSGVSDFYMFMGYMLLLTVGSLWVVYYKKWHFLVVESFIATVVYSIIAIFYGLHQIDESHTLFMFIFAAVFFIASIVAMLEEELRELKKVSLTYLTVALFNTVFIVAWTYLGFAEDMISLVFLGWALLFITSSFVVYSISLRATPFLVYGASAMLLLGFVTIAELDAETLLIAFTLEAVAAILATAFLTHSAKVVTKSSLLFAIPTIFATKALWDMADSHDLLSLQSVSLYFFLIALSSLAGFLLVFFKEQYEQIVGTLKSFWTIVIGFVFILLWVIPHVIFSYNHDMATMISLFIYTAIGLGLYFNKHPRQRELLHKSGIALLSLVVARLILVDVWRMDKIVRIIVFVMVGIALIVTAYRYSHKKEQQVDEEL